MTEDSKKRPDETPRAGAIELEDNMLDHASGGVLNRAFPPGQLGEVEQPHDDSPPIQGKAGAQGA